MTDDTLLPFDLPAVRRKKLTVDFLTVGINLPMLVCCCCERPSAGLCRRLAEAMPDRRDPDRIRHAMLELVMARAAAIACGHKDANDLDQPRHDPLMKIAVGRCPQSGAPLASQSTISRLENAPSKSEAALASQSTISRLENAPSKSEAARLCTLVDQFGFTVKPGRLEILDIR